MPEMIYSFNGKDITMNVCIQIRTISGNPRQFNYRDESARLCISAH